MAKITIQKAAAILIEAGHTFSVLQPVLTSGKFEARYVVDGEEMNAAGVLKRLVSE